MDAGPTEPLGTVDRYRLLELVGTGGMSQVYRAWDCGLDREVAVKLLHPHLASKEESRRRLSREARTVAKLHHPNILEIYDFSGDGAAKAYLVTEFIRGMTLRRFADEVGFGSPTLGALCGHSLATAVEHAHALGIIHRDIKPENVMVRDDGVLKLMDFGIARALEQGERMTMTGSLVGSPAHMAPEIIEGSEADVRSDVFSLGTLLYWICTGRLPFEAPTTTAVLKRILDGRYEDARTFCSEISEPLWACLRGALERDPARRLPTALALRERLEVALREDGIDRPAEELPRFFADPVGYREAFRQGLHTLLVARADGFAREGHGARALSIVNRILALDPHSADADRIIGVVAGSRRRRRLTRVGLGLLVAASAIAVGLFARPDAPPTPKRSRPPARTSAPATPRTAPDLRALVRPSVNAAPIRAVRPAESHHPSARAVPAAAASVVPSGSDAPAPGQLRLFVQPYADVYIDGTKRASAVPMVDLELSRGDHEVRLVHPDCEDWARRVHVDATTGGSPLRIRLQPKPAWLRVVSAPPDAEVMVDGVFRGTARETATEPLRIPMRDQSTRRVLVRLFKPGFHDLVRDVALRANASSELDASLERASGPELR